jgi:hypothetical protein
MKRRPVALLCVAALLVVVVAVPLAAPAGVIADACGALPAPARALLANPAPCGARRQSLDLVALLLFRGPPVPRFSVEKPTENTDREESWRARGDGSRSC